MAHDTVRDVGVTVAAVVAVVAHLAAGYFYLVSGLVIPGPWLYLLWLWWLALAWVLVRLIQRRSLWVLLVPVVAGLTWWLVLVSGERWLGWTA